MSKEISTQEAIEKQKAKLVTEIIGPTTCVCPACNKLILKDSYCSRCGQKLMIPNEDYNNE